MDRLIESTVVLALMAFVAISLFMIEQPYNIREAIEKATFAPPSKQTLQKARFYQGR